MHSADKNSSNIKLFVLPSNAQTRTKYEWNMSGAAAIFPALSVSVERENTDAAALLHPSAGKMIRSTLQTPLEFN